MRYASQTFFKHASTRRFIDRQTMNGRLVLRTTGATHKNNREFADSAGFAITHVSTLSDGAHRVIVHGETPFDEWVVPDTDGRLIVATKQPAVPPHFDFVPAPKPLPLV